MFGLYSVTGRNKRDRIKTCRLLRAAMTSSQQEGSKCTAGIRDSELAGQKSTLKCREKKGT